jgi:hypothetical protein
VFLLDPDGSRERTLLFTSGLFPLAGSVEARNGPATCWGPEGWCSTSSTTG